MAELAQRTAEELFLLDTRGWVVIEDALTRQQLAALSTELERATALNTRTGVEGELMVAQSKADGTVRRWPFPYHWGPAFTALIDNPRITPLLHGRLGAGVKLDHECVPPRASIATRFASAQQIPSCADDVCRRYVQTLKPDGSGRPVLSGGIHGGPRNHATGAGAITGSARGELLTVVYELLDVCVRARLLQLLWCHIVLLTSDRRYCT